MCMDDLKLRPYAAGPYYHHEALDGSGYPRGLTKKDIPYEAQIIRVADEYDAIPVGCIVSAALDLGGTDTAIDNDKILRGVEHAEVSVVVFLRLFVLSELFSLSDKLLYLFFVGNDTPIHSFHSGMELTKFFKQNLYL